MALKIAAILTAVLAVLHSVLGEKYILIRLFRRENLPKLFGGDSFTKGTLRFCWHIMTVFGLGFGAIMWQLSEVQAGQFAEISEGIRSAIAGAFFASAALAAYFTRLKHLSWVVFLAIAILVYQGG